MRLVLAAALIVPLLPGSSSPGEHSPAPQGIRSNDNRMSAGMLGGGVLRIRLEVREGVWHPDRDEDAGITVRAFAEEGRAASVPGPLIRVPEGTEIRASVRNTLTRGRLVVQGLSTRGAPATAADTFSVAPGESREVSFVAGTPGTYYYRGIVSGAPAPDGSSIDAALNGAFVIDPRGQRRPDRIFVLGLWTRTPQPGGVVVLDDVRALHDQWQGMAEHGATHVHARRAGAIPRDQHDRKPCTPCTCTVSISR